MTPMGYHSTFVVHTVQSSPVQSITGHGRLDVTYEANPMSSQYTNESASPPTSVLIPPALSLAPSHHQHHHHAAGDIGDIGGNSSWSMGRTSSFTHTAFPIAEAKAGAASSPPPISSRGRLVRLSVWLAGRGSSVPRTCIPAECSSVSRMTAGRKKAALLRRRCAPSSPPTSSSNSSSHHLRSVSAAGRQVCLAE